MIALAAVAALALGAVGFGAWHCRPIIGRTIRAAKIALRDPAIPRPLRALAAFAVLPIPGPVDEVAAVVALAILALAYRPRMIAAWNAAAPAPDGPPAP